MCFSTLFFPPYPGFKMRRLHMAWESRHVMVLGRKKTLRPYLVCSHVAVFKARERSCQALPSESIILFFFFF